eukprot:9664726-Lingulodinium_polyedra.AAC.1
MVERAAAPVPSRPVEAAPPANVKGAGKIMLATLPPSSGFETWRFQPRAAIVAASARPRVIGPWLSVAGGAR